VAASVEVEEEDALARAGGRAQVAAHLGGDRLHRRIGAPVPGNQERKVRRELSGRDCGQPDGEHSAARRTAYKDGDP
jgi:hypothetical protein